MEEETTHGIQNENVYSQLFSRGEFSTLQKLKKQTFWAESMQKPETSDVHGLNQSEDLHIYKISRAHNVKKPKCNFSAWEHTPAIMKKEVGLQRTAHKETEKLPKRRQIPKITFLYVQIHYRTELQRLEEVCSSSKILQNVRINRFVEKKKQTFQCLKKK